MYASLNPCFRGSYSMRAEEPVIVEISEKS